MEVYCSMQLAVLFFFFFPVCFLGLRGKAEKRREENWKSGAELYSESRREAA